MTAEIREFAERRRDVQTSTRPSSSASGIHAIQPMGLGQKARTRTVLAYFRRTGDAIRQISGCRGLTQ